MLKKDDSRRGCLYGNTNNLKVQQAQEPFSETHIKYDIYLEHNALKRPKVRTTRNFEEQTNNNNTPGTSVYLRRPQLLPDKNFACPLHICAALQNKCTIITLKT